MHAGSGQDCLRPSVLAAGILLLGLLVRMDAEHQRRAAEREDAGQGQEAGDTLECQRQPAQRQALAERQSREDDGPTGSIESIIGSEIARGAAW